MRIGILTGEYPPMPGGIGAHCRVLAKTLAQQGHAVYVLSHHEALNSDDDLHVTPAIKRWTPQSLRTIKRWVKEQSLDVLNMHFQTAAYGMSPWVHFIPRYVNHLPVITTFHDLRFPYLFPKAGRLRDWIVMYLAKSSDGIIVTNHADYEPIKHLHPSKIIPIGSSIPQNLPDGYQRQAWRNQWGIGENDFLLTHFGFVKHIKGVDILIETLAQLKQEQCPAKLLMIGQRVNTIDTMEDAYLAQLDSQIERLGLTDDVQWTGYADAQSISAYFDMADVAVFPFRDGVSYRHSSFIAAIEHECAIVTTQPQMPIETFVHGGNMCLFPVDDTKALTATLHELYENDTLKRQLQAGAKQLKALFDWQAIAHEHVQFFQQFLEG